MRRTTGRSGQPDQQLRHTYEAQNYINSTHDFAPRTSLAYGIPRKNGKTDVPCCAAALASSMTDLAWAASRVIDSRATPRTSRPRLPVPRPRYASCTLYRHLTVPVHHGRRAPPPANRDSGSRTPACARRTPIESRCTAGAEGGQVRQRHGDLPECAGGAPVPDRGPSPALDACPRPVDYTAYINCKQSEGIYRQNQINTNIRIQTPKGTSITGFYSANWANSNTERHYRSVQFLRGLRAGELCGSQPDVAAGHDPPALPDHGEPDHASVIRSALQHYDWAGQQWRRSLRRSSGL